MKLPFLRSRGKHVAPKPTRVVGSEPMEDVDGRPMRHSMPAEEADREDLARQLGVMTDRGVA
jgi:hypothetical protein